MKNVIVTDARVEGDRILVTGTVDGTAAVGGGWASRIQTAKSEEAKQRYLKEVLLHGTPLSQEELETLVSAGPNLPEYRNAVHIPAGLGTPSRARPLWRQDIEEYFKTCWIPVTFSFILGALLEHFLRW